MNHTSTPPCAFGPFQLDPSEHRLLRDGRPVPLTPKVFDVLCVLVREHGRLVSKERLLEEVWPERFVDEANLNRCVSVLRKALGESAGKQRYIETVPKVGYRFVAPVTTYPADEPAGVGAAPAAPAVAAPSLARRTVAVIGSVVAMGLLIFLVAGRVWSGATTGGRSAAPSHRQLTFTGREGLPTISPDGKRLAYVSSTGATKRVMVQAVDGGQPVEIFSGSGAGSLRWSPASTELVFWARTPEWEGIFAVAVSGGAPRRISHGSYVAAWSPTASRLRWRAISSDE